jgi:hypothetical protein
MTLTGLTFPNAADSRQPQRNSMAAARRRAVRTEMSTACPHIYQLFTVSISRGFLRVDFFA